MAGGRHDGDVHEADDPKVTTGKMASSSDKATLVLRDEDPNEDDVIGAKTPVTPKFCNIPRQRPSSLG